MHSPLYRLTERLSLERSANPLEVGRTGVASAPSNLALVKYWGKLPTQAGLPHNPLPANPSVSLTLGSFRTRVILRIGEQDGPRFSSLEAEALQPTPLPLALQTYLEQLTAGWGEDLHLRVGIASNFPVGCGIASSAAFYAAVAGAMGDLLCLPSRWSPLEASSWITDWARRGSGSASRSTSRETTPHAIRWEITPEGRPDNPAGDGDWPTRIRPIPLPQAVASSLRHALLVLDPREKSISSRAGHASASASPLQPLRVADAFRRSRQVEDALTSGDFAPLMALAEAEAFALHAVALTGLPQAAYLTEACVRVIESFVRRRDALGAQAFWTLDAGPNPHFVYLSSAEAFMAAFLDENVRTLGATALSSRPFGRLILGESATDDT